MQNIKDIIIDNFTEDHLESVEFPIIAIYESPKDFPGKYVARLWEIGAKPTQYIVIKESLEKLRNCMPKDIVRIERQQQEDPVIVETWLPITGYIAFTIKETSKE